MKYDLDRTIRLEPNPEFKNLYKWCLQEFDECGAQTGRDYIPWPWTLTFIATKIIFTNELRFSPKPDDGDTEPLRETRVIRLDLQSGRPGASRHWNTSFSMMGTSRTISEIVLRIVEDDEHAPSSRAYGGVANTYDDGLRSEELPDLLEFSLYVSPTTFQRYADAIARNAVDTVCVSLGRVKGFYSDWSPDIHTNEVKVLTHRREQPVAIPEGCEIEPPRLREIGEITLHFIREKEGLVPAADPEPWDEEIDQADATEPTPLPRPSSFEMHKLFSSIRTGIWIVAALLFAILLKGL